MPPHFTKVFAENLQKIVPLKFYEATQGQKVEVNSVYIAPGDFHMEVRKGGGLLSIVLHQDAPLHNVRPAADFLLRSVAEHVGSTATGVVLTGMGRDGAQGLLEMKNKGCFTLAQSEKTCVVFGMPQAAHQIGATKLLVDLEQIPVHILKSLRLKHD